MNIHSSLYLTTVHIQNRLFCLAEQDTKHCPPCGPDHMTSVQCSAELGLLLKSNVNDTFNFPSITLVTIVKYLSCDSMTEN